MRDKIVVDSCCELTEELLNEKRVASMQQVYVVEEGETIDSNLYKINTAHNVYPVVNLKSTTMITGGNGTSGDPYVVYIEN